MWKPGDVIPQHRRRAVLVWSSLMLAIVAYSGWLLYKAVQRTKAPETSFVLSNKVYKYPDLWICPYVQYGCDTLELEAECVASAWETEAGPPDAVFYPRETLEQLHQTTTEELQIDVSGYLTNEDEEGNTKEGRGHCVVFETSAADAFEGQERSSSEYLDYIILDMYWNPGGLSENSTTCVPEGHEWDSHREWVYAFLSDSKQEGMISTGIQLSYSCITATSDTHTFNTMSIGLTDQNKYNSEDLSSYKALFTNVGIYKDKVNPNITVPYARLSLEMKQNFDSWEIITEANPFEIAEMFGNIGGFWDLLLILWPIFFVAATRQEPQLKPRTFKKSIARGAERAAGIAKVIPRPGPIRRSSAVAQRDSVNISCLEEERPSWDQPPPPRPRPPPPPYDEQQATETALTVSDGRETFAEQHQPALSSRERSVENRR